MTSRRNQLLKKLIGNEADLIDKETEKKIIEKWQTQLGKL